MRLGRGFTAVARQVPRLAAGRALPCAPHCALCAQGTRGTCGLAGVLPPWHNRCHGSPVWQGFALRPSLRAMRAGHSGDMRLGRGFTAVAQQVPRLASLAGLCPAPSPAHSAQRRSGTCGLVGVLPPWHDRCHGSPVWQGFALRPSLRAMRAGHSGDMRLGRGFTAVAQRVPRLAGLVEQNCRLASKCRRFPAKIALLVKTLPHFPVLMRLIRGAIVDFRQAFHQNRGFCS